ncbi:MAG: hypothetical protein AB1644_13485 [Candidatus Zixiibacteriota bacterium]
MKQFLIINIALLLSAGPALALDSASVSPERFGIACLTDYLNLRPDDISFRKDYTEPDSLRLRVVADLMQRPLDMIDHAGTFRGAYAKGQPEIAAGILFRDMAGEYQSGRSKPYRADGSEVQRKYTLYYTNLYLNQLLTQAATYLDVIFPRSTEMSLALLTARQKSFLRNEFKSLVTMDEREEFMSAEQLDSIEKAQEQYTDSFAVFGPRIDKDPIVAAGIDCLRELLLQLTELRSYLDSSKGAAERMVKPSGFIPTEVKTDLYLGKQKGWAVGGAGDDIYKGDFQFILDLGGNDSYELTYDPAHPHGVIIVDLSGNDRYIAKTDYTLGSGCFSVGLLLDFGGDDQYSARSFGLGSGYYGFGLLYDAGGNDRYDGDTHVQGAGTFGLGLLIDESGRDIYNAAVYSQGFGFVQGLGAIYELDGSDSYYAGGKYKDNLRFRDHYLSLSQGFGYGIRPTLSGGIGAIVDLKGSDTYYSDIFAQGASYWWSLGILYDSSGNDSYQSFQYAQGAATHMTLGALIDDYGNDVYFGKRLMHGCGHDYSCGLILDRHGNDTYTAYDLSQGAGSANGVGIQIDNEGEDRYLVKDTVNTQGFGDSRRDFGSIGLLIDLGGADQYNGHGRNNAFWKTASKWGGGMDIEETPKDTLATRP